jgi:hypothetical protein
MPKKLRAPGNVGRSETKMSIAGGCPLEYDQRRSNRVSLRKGSGMSIQAPNSSAKSGLRRPWVTRIFPLIAALSLVVIVLAGAWERHNQMKRLERMKSELDQLQARLDAVQGAVDERQKQGGQQRPAAEKAKPPASEEKSARPDSQKRS